MTIKRQKDEFLVITLKHVNHSGTPKLWTIAHETALKRKKDEFLVITLKHVNHPKTPKPWAITHENDHKTQKRIVLAHTSQTCTSP